MSLPKKNTAYTYGTELVDQSDTRLFKNNPTLATGDFKVSIDYGSFANLGTLPTVTPSSNRQIEIQLASGEMNGDNIGLQCVDAAGAEWCDVFFDFSLGTRNADDLAYPATSGRSMVVDAAGLVDSTAVKVGPSGSATAQTAGDIFNAVTNIGATSAALSALATSRTLNGGTTETGTLANTYYDDGVYWTLNPSGNAIDVEVLFDVRATYPNGNGVSFFFKGYGVGVVNTYTFQVYDWVATAYKTLKTITGIASVLDQDFEEAINNNNVGTGGNAGQVKIRMSATGLTAGSLNVDQILVGVANVLTPPTNWSTTVISGAGVTSVNATQINGVSTSPVTTIRAVIGTQFDLAVNTVGGVTLADGVAHGGTPGSSTASLALDNAYIKSAATHAVQFEASATNKHGMISTGGPDGGGGVFKGGPGVGSDGVGLSILGANIPYTANADGLRIQGGDDSGNALSIGTSPGGIPIVIGSSNTDAIAITAAGDGSRAINAIGGVLFDATGLGTDGFKAVGDTNFDGFVGHSPGTGGGVGFRSDPDAVGFGGGGGSVNVASFDAAALAQFFTTDTTKVFADAVSGSVVAEIANNTGALTAAEIATGIFTDANASDFTTPGTPGSVLVTQLGGTFTTNTSTVFSTAALANAPGGSSGVNVTKILGTPITESGAGNLARNISFFYDVNPTTTKTVNDIGGPVASVIGDVGGKVLGGGSSSIVGVGAWVLNDVGNTLATSASQVSILNAVNAITTQIALSRPIVPATLIIPPAASTDYELDLNLYDSDGVPVNADGNVVTIHARDGSGNSLDDHLASTSMTHVATGRYKVVYTVQSTDVNGGEVIYDFTWAVSSVNLYDAAATTTQDASSVLDIAAIKAQTDKLTFDGSNFILSDPQGLATTDQMADAFIGRNIRGGSSTGRTMGQSFAALRNKVAFDVPGAGQFTVFDTDDTTPLWTGSYVRSAVQNLTAVDPA